MGHWFDGDGAILAVLNPEQGWVLTLEEFCQRESVRGLGEIQWGLWRSRLPKL